MKVHEEPAAQPTCTLLLVRHAHCAMAGRFCGLADPPLSDEGRAQLPALAEKIAQYPVTQIFSSDRERAKATAYFLAEQLHLTVQVMPELRELSFGEWEGLSWDEAAARFPEHAERWMKEYPHLAAPGGEAFVDFRQRARKAIAEIARAASGGCAVVVTHAGVIRSCLLDAANLPERELGGIACEYASCTELRVAQ
jgi:broad specificity phosphatase PhoE